MDHCVQWKVKNRTVVFLCGPSNFFRKWSINSVLLILFETFCMDIIPILPPKLASSSHMKKKCFSLDDFCTDRRLSSDTLKFIRYRMCLLYFQPPCIHSRCLVRSWVLSKHTHRFYFIDLYKHRVVSAGFSVCFAFLSATKKRNFWEIGTNNVVPDWPFVEIVAWSCYRLAGLSQYLIFICNFLVYNLIWYCLIIDIHVCNYFSVPCILYILLESSHSNLNIKIIVLLNSIYELFY
jgi:hypothetical protein